MGYRSDIAITAYGNKTKLAELKSFYEDAKGKLNEEESANLKYIVDASLEDSQKPLWNDDGEFFFYGDNLKWYDGYPTVDLINSVHSKAIELGLAAEFLRIGEQVDDIDEFYDDGDDSDSEGWGCEYRLQISRSINF